MKELKRFEGIYLNDSKRVPNLPKTRTYYLLKTGKVYYVDRHGYEERVDTRRVFLFRDLKTGKVYKVDLDERQICLEKWPSRCSSPKRSRRSECSRDSRSSEEECKPKCRAQCGNPQKFDTEIVRVTDPNKRNVRIPLKACEVYIPDCSEIKLTKDGYKLDCFKGDSVCIGLSEIPDGGSKSLTYRYKECGVCYQVTVIISREADDQDFAVIKYSGTTTTEIAPGTTQASVNITNKVFQDGLDVFRKVSTTVNNRTIHLLEVLKKGVYRVTGAAQLAAPVDSDSQVDLRINLYKSGTNTQVNYGNDIVLLATASVLLNLNAGDRLGLDFLGALPGLGDEFAITEGSLSIELVDLQ